MSEISVILVVHAAHGKGIWAVCVNIKTPLGNNKLYHRNIVVTPACHRNGSASGKGGVSALNSFVP